MAQDTKDKTGRSQKAAQAPASTGKQSTEERTASLVYVGPNMAGDLTLRTHTVFRGGLPGHLKKAVAQDRELAALFVPVADLAGARVQLKKQGSPLQRAHNETLRKYLAARGAK